MKTCSSSTRVLLAWCNCGSSGRVVWAACVRSHGYVCVFASTFACLMLSPDRVGPTLVCAWGVLMMLTALPACHWAQHLNNKSVSEAVLLLAGRQLCVLSKCYCVTVALPSSNCMVVGQEHPNR